MRRLTKFAFLFFLLGSSVTFAEHSCRVILKGPYLFPPHFGDQRGNEWVLGEGLRGEVSRIPGLDYNRKPYKEGHEHFAAIDAINLEYLDTVPSSSLRIRTAKRYLSEDGRYLWIEDIVGQTLAKILFTRNGGYDLDLRKNLYQRYMNYLAMVETMFKPIPGVTILRVAHPKLVFMRKQVPFLKIEAPSLKIILTIKPDNFIVDATNLEAVVVDPN